MEGFSEEVAVSRGEGLGGVWVLWAEPGKVVWLGQTAGIVGERIYEGGAV